MTRHRCERPIPPALPLLCALLVGGMVVGCNHDAAQDDTGTRDASRAAPAEPAPSEVPDTAPTPDRSDAPPPTIGNSSGASTRTDGTAILRDVRTGEHAGADRVTFEFEGAGLPAWEVEYVDRPVRDCGSGEAVPVAGDGWLEIRFVGAQAHTEAGEPTSGPRRRTVNQPVMRELVRTCDFEGHVTYVVGVGSPNAYTPQVMESPSRLVIDIAH